MIAKISINRDQGKRETGAWHSSVVLLTTLPILDKNFTPAEMLDNVQKCLNRLVKAPSNQIPY
jgi:hypothetical protein